MGKQYQKLRILKVFAKPLNATTADEACSHYSAQLDSFILALRQGCFPALEQYSLCPVLHPTLVDLVLQRSNFDSKCRVAGWVREANSEFLSARRI
jgi:hypothetical protein